jgi:hypothetical protein
MGIGGVRVPVPVPVWMGAVRCVLLWTRWLRSALMFLPNGDLLRSNQQEVCYFPGAGNLPRGLTLSRSNGRCTSTINANNLIGSKTGRVCTVEGLEIRV